MNKTLAILVTLFSPTILAVDFQFEDLSREDLENIVGDFSAVSVHTTVSGAEPLGEVWGLEVGMLGGVSQADEIDAIFVREGVAAEADYLPRGLLFGRLSTPLNLTLEAGILPQIGNEEFEFSLKSAALMWSSGTWLPLDLAVKGHISWSDVSFEQQVNSLDTQVDYENTVQGIELIASYSFPFLDPYIGLGYLEGNGDMTIAGTDNFYNFTTSQSASAKNTGMEFFIGFELDLILKLGLEYAERFGESTYTAKLSFDL